MSMYTSTQAYICDCAAPCCVLADFRPVQKYGQRRQCEVDRSEKLRQHQLRKHEGIFLHCRGYNRHMSAPQYASRCAWTPTAKFAHPTVNSKLCVSSKRVILLRGRRKTGVKNVCCRRALFPAAASPPPLQASNASRAPLTALHERCHTALPLHYTECRLVLHAPHVPLQAGTGIAYVIRHTPPAACSLSMRPPVADSYCVLNPHLQNARSVRSPIAGSYSVLQGASSHSMRPPLLQTRKACAPTLLQACTSCAPTLLQALTACAPSLMHARAACAPFALLHARTGTACGMCPPSPQSPPTAGMLLSLEPAYGSRYASLGDRNNIRLPARLHTTSIPVSPGQPRQVHTRGFWGGAI